MATSKYLAVVAGRMTEVAATTVSSGTSSDGAIVALNASGKLDGSVLPDGIGTEQKVIQASENLVAGNLINIWDNAGQFRVRKADGSTIGKEANGFVLADVSVGQPAVVYLEGTVSGLMGLTPGRYYLSTSPGDVTPTPPSLAGNVLQYIGIALSPTELTFEPNDGVILS
jgi:hypothetical protein